MTSIREINDLAALDEHRSRWAELLAETADASFFQSLEWLECYWRHFGRSQHLRVLLAERDKRLVGIVPLVVRTEPTRVGPMRVLTYPLHDWGTFYGPIGPAPAEALRAALEHVRRTPRDWDLLDLRWIDEFASNFTQAAFEQAGFAAQREPWNQCPQIELAGGWDAYWAGRTSRWRNNVRRSEKKLAQHGTVEYLRYRPAGACQHDDDPRWDLYEACERVAGGSWQADSSSGTTLTHAAIRPFLRDCHLAAARAGCLDMNLLLVARRPVAFNYAYHYRGYVYGLRTGFTAEPAADGAGSVLQMQMIRDSFSRGDRLYDLGPGYLDCKRYWQTRIAPSYRYTHFPVALRPQLVRAKRTVAGWLRHHGPQGGKP